MVKFKIMKCVLFGALFIIFLAFIFLLAPPKEINKKAFVVLGYNLKEDGSEKIMTSRVKAALMDCSPNIDYVILSGGKEYTSFGIFRIPIDTENTEAKKMKDIWIENNDYCNATLLLEEDSYYSFQNAYNSLKLAKTKEVNSLVIFTNENHLRYVSFLFYLNKLILFSTIKLEFKKANLEDGANET